MSASDAFPPQNEGEYETAQRLSSALADQMARVRRVARTLREKLELTKAPDQGEHLTARERAAAKTD